MTHERTTPHFLGLGIAVGVAILLSVFIVIGLILRQHHRLDAEAAQRQRLLDQGTRILTTVVRKEPAGRTFTLPADVRAFQQATLYAKVSGYVKWIKVDKGDKVRSGDALARLESPEIDQQVLSAIAELQIKERTFQRYAALVREHFISREDFDVARSQYEVAQATLKRLRALQNYELLRAPFQGTITGRYVDAGALIPAANAGTAGAMPLVDLADLSQLRVTVFVQQDLVSYLNLGDAVELSADDRPELIIKASMNRISRNLDPRTRTMLCEIWLKNEYGLYPGEFMHATLHLHTPTLPTIPTSAIVVRNGQLLAGSIENRKIKFVPIKTGLDNGRQIQIVSGLQEGQVVGIDIPSELVDGAAVQPIPLEANPASQRRDYDTGKPSR